MSKSRPQSIIEFNPKLPKLSKNEKQVLKILIEAAKLIAPIYLEQEKQARLRLDKEEIEKAAQKDLDILSPYTVIEKNDGRIIATPYHIKYENLLKPIADKLNRAASITDSKEFGEALRLQAKALLDGSYEKATAKWLKIEPYILDINIGPVAYYADNQLFYSKASYQSWVGVRDLDGTQRLNNYKTTTLGIRRKNNTQNRVDNYDKVKARVNDAILFSGFMAKMKFVGISLPMDFKEVEKYGSQITLFNQANDLRLKEQVLPTFNEIFPEVFKKEFSKEDLRRGYLRATALHELAHSYLLYKNAVNNLKDLFGVIVELSATVLGLRLAGSLLLKERIDEKMLESMIVTYLCRSFYHMKYGRNNNSMINYALGGLIFINFILENGALKMTKGMAIPNFMKIFLALPELSDNLESLLSSGTYQEAKNFIKRYTQGNYRS